MITANWKNLVILNYKCPPEILKRYLPLGSTLDYFNGETYLSLVAFQFFNTKIFGIPAFGHENFPEINLSFYVKKNGKRAVAFIKEIVDKPFVAYIANKIWKEHYQTETIKTDIQKNYPYYDLQFTIPDKLAIKIEADPVPETLREGSLEEFITEHSWGVSTDKCNSMYQLDHPKWLKHNVLDYKIEGDLKKIYPDDLQRVLEKDPNSAFVCNGSKVTISLNNKE